MKVAPWIQTYTGRKFWLNNPKPEDIDVNDIAHSLSMQCRYVGHTKKFYSIAEHCCLVSTLLEPSFRLSGLLHDAAEAYVGDMTKPLKELVGHSYKDIENNISNVINQKYGDFPRHVYRDVVFPAIKHADQQMLRIEAQQVLNADPVENWHLLWPKASKKVRVMNLSPETAKKMFLGFYQAYSK